MKKTRFVVKEIDIKNGYKWTRVLAFTCSSYRECVSVNYFFYHTNQRNWKPSHAKCEVLYTAAFEDDYARDQKFAKASGLNYWKDDIVEFNSLWDFYKAIGYDYKKQKWLST